MTLDLGWFTTGRDAAAGALFDAVHGSIEDGTIDARFSFVFCSRERGESAVTDALLDRVEGLGIRLVAVSSRSFKPEMRKAGKSDPGVLERWRLEYDGEVLKALEGFSQDLGVLAGYMLIVSPLLCQKMDLINLHPAKPGGPKGTWQEVIWELLGKRAEDTGVMMHLVTEVLDEGPPVAFCTFPIRGEAFDPLWAALDDKLADATLPEIIADEGENEPLFREIRRQGFARELPLIVSTVKAFADGRVTIRDKKPVSGGEILRQGYDLSAEINHAVRGVL